MADCTFSLDYVEFRIPGNRYSGVARYFHRRVSGSVIYWERQEAVDAKNGKNGKNEHIFYTCDKDSKIALAYVAGSAPNEYLTTHADESSANNIDNLPPPPAGVIRSPA